jgi:hypothetical protein
MGDAKKREAKAISIPLPNLLIGAITMLSLNPVLESLAFPASNALFDFSLLFMLAISPSLSNPSVPSIAPGTIPTTLTLYGPHSTARVLVMVSTPAFAAPE